MSKRRFIISILLVLVMALAAVGLTTAQDERPLVGVNFRADDDGQAVVTQVMRRGPAADAGIEVDDVIVAINGEAVTADTLADQVAAFAAGETITVTVERDGETLDLEVRLGERDVAPMRSSANAVGFLGVQVEDTDDGLVVESVVAGSPAAEGGLLAGDVLTSIDGEPIEEARVLVELIRSFRDGETVTVGILRDGAAQELAITLGRNRLDRSPMQIIIGGDDIVYLDEENVWEVRELDADSTLAEAGLQAGDRITAVNGEPLQPGDLRDLLRGVMPDGTVTLTVERDSEALEIEVPLLALTSLVMPSFGGRFNDDIRSRIPDGLRGINRPLLGVTFETLEVGNEFEVDNGALIVTVQFDSAADEAGLQVGDIILSVDGDVVDAERTLSDRLYAYEVGDTLTLEVLRDGETLSLDVTLGSLR